MRRALEAQRRPASQISSIYYPSSGHETCSSRKELTHHLGYEKHNSSGDNSGNSRNGTTPKTMRGERGQVQLDVPRDRDSSFEPPLVKKGHTRFDGLDEKIISLYSRGMTQREIQGHLKEIYGVEISPSLISTLTDAVLDEVRTWQARPLDSVYPILGSVFPSRWANF